MWAVVQTLSHMGLLSQGLGVKVAGGLLLLRMSRFHMWREVFLVLMSRELRKMFEEQPCSTNFGMPAGKVVHRLPAIWKLERCTTNKFRSFRSWPWRHLVLHFSFHEPWTLTKNVKLKPLTRSLGLHYETPILGKFWHCRV